MFVLIILRNEINKKQFMPKGISFVGLMDLGTLDALKKSPVEKIAKTPTQQTEVLADTDLKESNCKAEETTSAAQNGKLITYPQPC